MSKFKVGDKVRTPLGVGVVSVEEEFISDLDEWFIKVVVGKEFGFNRVLTFEVNDLKPYVDPQERLFDLGFERVAKHKYIKHHKGGLGYDTPYKITIEFAFNSYQVKCEGENWVGVDLELARIITDYLDNYIKEKYKRKI